MIYQELFSPDKGDWESPQALFEYLNRVFHFDLDACATPESARCAEYYTEQDSPVRDWTRFNCVFLSLHDDTEIGEFVRKAFETARLSTPVVCLLPARVEEKWFADYCVGLDDDGVEREIYFLKDRLQSGYGEPSMVLIMSSNVFADIDHAE